MDTRQEIGLFCRLRWQLGFSYNMFCALFCHSRKFWGRPIYPGDKFTANTTLEVTFIE